MRLLLLSTLQHCLVLWPARCLCCAHACSPWKPASANGVRLSRSRCCEMLPCDLQALAKRTVGIFNYPKNSDPAQVSDHAHGYGVIFGEVRRVSIKTGRDLQLYAIINFCSADAALAAVQQSQKPLFMGTAVNPSAWKLPWQPISSGGLLGLGHFFYAKTASGTSMPVSAGWPWIAGCLVQSCLPTWFVH